MITKVQIYELLTVKTQELFFATVFNFVLCFYDLKVQMQVVLGIKSGFM